MKAARHTSAARRRARHRDRNEDRLARRDRGELERFNRSMRRVTKQTLHLFGEDADEVVGLHAVRVR